MLQDKPLDMSIKAYKAEQTKAQREGYDVGTYPQWRKTMEKKDKFRQELLAEQIKKEVKEREAKAEAPKKKPAPKKRVTKKKVEK